MFKKGHKKLGGRQKGTCNKNSADVRQMILQSLDARGGAEYLNNLPDDEFNKLLSRVIPKDMKIDGNLGIQWIVRDLTGKKPAKKEGE